MGPSGRFSDWKGILDALWQFGAKLETFLLPAALEMLA
jgi:hypothetical protein